MIEEENMANTNSTVYLLSHMYESERGCDECKIIGIFREREEAESVIANMKDLPGFRDHPIDKWYVDKYVLGKTKWADGFVTVD